MRTEREEIILCNKCGGKGIVERSKLVDYHKGESEYWTEICDNCNGSGRLLLKTIEETTAYKQREI